MYWCGSILYHVDTQHSEICIIDGTFAWQTSGERGSSFDEPLSGSTSVEASDDVPHVDHCSDEAAAVLLHGAVPANGIQPTLIDINFTVPKVNFIL